MKRRILILSLSVCAVLLAACGHCTKSEAPPATPFTMELSCGGGFSGMHTGFVIKSDGSILYWRGMHGRREDVRPLGSVAVSVARDLKARADAAGLATLVQRETGNMTTMLAVSEGDLLYTITWPGMDTETDAVPAAVKPLHAEFLRVLAPFRDKAMELSAPGTQK